MPQGQAAVTWTPENDVKLFLTVLAVQAVQVDYAAVAKVFGKCCPVAWMNMISSVRCNHLVLSSFQLNLVVGPNVPGSCIQSRMKALRKKANEMGVSPFSLKSAATKRPLATATGTPVKRRKVEKTKSEIDIDESEEEGKALLATPTNSDDNEGVKIGPMTPPSSAKPAKGKKEVHAMKSRVSPRKAAKKDYKTLGDPYVAMENANDSNGEKIFGEEKSESEDSAASDGDFRAELIQAIPVVEI